MFFKGVCDVFLLIFCGVRCSECGGAGNLGCAMLGQLQWEALWALGKRLVSTYAFMERDTPRLMSI